MVPNAAESMEFMGTLVGMVQGVEGLRIDDLPFDTRRVQYR